MCCERTTPLSPFSSARASFGVPASPLLARVSSAGQRPSQHAGTASRHSYPLLGPSICRALVRAPHPPPVGARRLDPSPLPPPHRSQRQACSQTGLAPVYDLAYALPYRVPATRCGAWGTTFSPRQSAPRPVSTRTSTLAHPRTEEGVGRGGSLTSKSLDWTLPPLFNGHLPAETLDASTWCHAAKVRRASFAHPSPSFARITTPPWTTNQLPAAARHMHTHLPTSLFSPGRRRWWELVAIT